MQIHTVIIPWEIVENDKILPLSFNDIHPVMFAWQIGVKLYVIGGADESSNEMASFSLTPPTRQSFTSWLRQTQPCKNYRTCFYRSSIGGRWALETSRQGTPSPRRRRSAEPGGVFTLLRSALCVIAAVSKQHLDGPHQSGSIRRKGRELKSHVWRRSEGSAQTRRCVLRKKS